jgi:L-rhamnose mutarotase
MRMRHCFHLQVRPERTAQFVARHQAVWPEMQDAPRARCFHLADVEKK